MDFSLHEDEVALQQLARDFAAKEIRPHAARYWDEERCPTEVLRRMGDLGLLGLLVPEEWVIVPTPTLRKPAGVVRLVEIVPVSPESTSMRPSVSVKLPPLRV